MKGWPAVHWTSPDGDTGTRLFSSVGEAQRWSGERLSEHPNWEWVLAESSTIPEATIFSIDYGRVGSDFHRVSATILRFFIERADTFRARDWGLRRIEPLRPFGHTEGPDPYGVAEVSGKVAPQVVRELLEKDWFELFLWRGSEWVFGLDDETDVAFSLSEEDMVELECLGVARHMLRPEILGGHGYSFREQPRPLTDL